ncbi:MAG TPA: peptidoglycan DD-metalloendopeptidase family protein, partial [Candidatus Lustribacter sp.]|nr:peptidoglycan DD-metalloendopeptidase family protein [Candidatus Lustribacter sp.]
MKKAALLTPLLAVLFVPLFAAAFLASAQTPALAEQVRATQCSSAAIPATGAWRPPFQQAYALTSGFGQRFDPVYQRWQRHAGQDLASLPGPGPVVAAAAGKVTRAGPYGGYGNAVVLDNGAGTETTYGHLAGIDPKITVEATVWMGQKLGVEGSTGASTGSHLHFELHQDGTPIDPVPFMLAHGAPLTGHAVAPSKPPTTDPSSGTSSSVEGGIGFPLPEPGTPRQDSLHSPPTPIPAGVKALYVAAADRYKIPWTLLAGIGMEETGHGRNLGTSSAGAQGLMQLTPATWAQYGVDGDGDGRAVISDGADSVMSAASYLTRLGVSAGGQAGVSAAIFGYNHGDWYVNDVLFYANAYGGGTILGDPSDCGPGGNGNPTLPPLASERIATVLTWAKAQIGEPYVFGANGPNAWDCSS